jgi:NAD(P)-dependent dehydrogenase (short-subunit alcohol dehydrogenase family)
LEYFSLKGKRALITGGGKGLGQIFATALAQAGAEVANASRSLKDCQSTAKQITEQTRKKCLPFSADVTKASDVQKLVTDVTKDLGTVDILINNAGVNVRGAAHELAETDWDSVINVNLKAPFLVSRAIMPGMMERGWGRIINLGSILSVIAIAGRAPYASAKAGVLNLTKVLALEAAQSGVTVNAICPGPFATDMNKPLLQDPAKYQAFVQKIPMGRWGELQEITGAAVFLASDASSFVTGSALFVDGGWTAQ